MNLMEYVSMEHPVALDISSAAACFEQVHAAGGLGLVIDEASLLSLQSLEQPRPSQALSQEVH